MTATDEIGRRVVDAIPALVVAAFASIVMARQVDELDGRVGVLFVAGLIGVGLSSLLLLRRPAPEAEAEAPRAPSVAASSALLMPPPTTVAVTRATQPPRPPLQGSSLHGFDRFSLAKEGATAEENEDSSAVDADHGTIAVSDGASSSFGARVWSRALVDEAVRSVAPLDPSLVPSVMAAAAEQWQQHHTAEDLPWWAQEGLRRGGFATLLVVRIGEGPQGRAWQALAVGDSCVFHLRREVDGWQVVRAFPLETAEAFGSHPVLLSSVSAAPTDGIEFGDGELVAGDVLLAATDAVSEWLLGDPARLVLAAEAPLEDVERAVRAARQDRSMVNDDATFVRFIERNERTRSAGDE